MKIDRILCLCAVIAFPQLALAEPQSNNQSLETVHAIIDFCAQVDPANATKYQEQARLMFGGGFSNENEREVSTRVQGMDRDGKNDKYISAYEQTRDALDKVSKQDAVADCKGFLGINQVGSTSGSSEKEGSPDVRKP